VLPRAVHERGKAALPVSARLLFMGLFGDAKQSIHLADCRVTSTEVSPVRWCQHLSI